MKTIKVGKAIKRVDDENAFKQVKEGKAEFCKKSEWKQKVRDVKAKA